MIAFMSAVLVMSMIVLLGVCFGAKPTVKREFVPLCVLCIISTLGCSVWFLTTGNFPIWVVG